MVCDPAARPRVKERAKVPPAARLLPASGSILRHWSADAATAEPDAGDADRDAGTDADGSSPVGPPTEGASAFLKPPVCHAAFGLGIHRCIGSNLARMEMTVALEEWLKRIPDFRLDPAGKVTWSEGTVRGPRQLPVLFGKTA